ncbi:unnamed protein product, partial [marine sediment metagenome]
MKSFLKIIIIAIIVITVTLCFTTPIFGEGKGKAMGAAPKATGDVGYTAGFERSIEFNAHQISNAGTIFPWNVSGSWIISFEYLGLYYLHDVNLTQTVTTVGGSGGYLAGVLPYTYEWTITSGSVTDSNISLTMEYTKGAIGTTMTMTGTIAPDGTMSGTWSDDLIIGGRIGSWSSTSGIATAIVTGINGKGMLNYSDANGDWYQVDIKYVNVC